MSSRFTTDTLRIAMAQLLRIHGLDRMSGAAHDVVVDVSRRYLEMLARCTQEAALADGRSAACLFDLVQASDSVGVDVFELRDYLKEWRQAADRVVERRLKAAVAAAARAAAAATTTTVAVTAAAATTTNTAVTAAAATTTTTTTATAAAVTATSASTALPPSILKGEGLHSAKPAISLTTAEINHSRTSSTLAAVNSEGDATNTAVAAAASSTNDAAAAASEDKGPPVLGFPRMAPGPFPLDPRKICNGSVKAESIVPGHTDAMDVDSPSESLRSPSPSPTLEDLLPPLPTEHDYSQALACAEAEVPSWGNAIDYFLMDMDDDHAVDGDDDRGKSESHYLYPVAFCDSKMAKADNRPTQFPPRPVKSTQLHLSKNHYIKQSTGLLTNVVEGLKLQTSTTPVISRKDMAQYLVQRELVGISSFRDSLLPFERSLINDVFLMVLPNMSTVMGCELIPTEAHFLPAIEDMHDVRTRHEINSKRHEVVAATPSLPPPPLQRQPSVSMVVAPPALTPLPAASLTPLPTVKLKTLLASVSTPTPTLSSTTATPSMPKGSALPCAATPTSAAAATTRATNPISTIAAATPAPQQIRLAFTTGGKAASASKNTLSSTAVSTHSSALSTIPTTTSHAATLSVPTSQVATPTPSFRKITIVNSSPASTTLSTSTPSPAPISVPAHVSASEPTLVSSRSSKIVDGKPETASQISQASTPKPTIKLKSIMLPTKLQPQTPTPSKGIATQPSTVAATANSIAAVDPKPQATEPVSKHASKTTSHLQPESESHPTPTVSPHKFKLKFSISTPSPKPPSASTSTPLARSPHSSPITTPKPATKSTTKIGNTPPKTHTPSYGVKPPSASSTMGNLPSHQDTHVSSLSKPTLSSTIPLTCVTAVDDAKIDEEVINCICSAPTIDDGRPPTASLTNRPASRAGTGSCKYSRLDLISATSAMPPGTANRNPQTRPETATRINVVDRPTTQQGLAGVRGKTQGPGRMVQDVTFFQAELRQKMNLLIEEIYRINAEVNLVTKENSNYAAFEKRADTLSEELKELQGQLGDLNTLVDKLHTDTDLEELERQFHQLQAKNQRESQVLDEVFMQRQQRESSIRDIKSQIEEGRQKADDQINTLDPEKKAEYIRLKNENTAFIASIEKLQAEIEKQTQRTHKLQSELSIEPIKQKAVLLHDRLKESKDKKSELENTLKKAENESGPQEKARLLEQVREDNLETSGMDRRILELEDQIHKLHEQISQADTELDPAQEERNAKYEELLKRDRDMQTFLDSFDERRHERMEKNREAEAGIVHLLERIRTLSKKDITNLPSTDGFKGLQGDLEFKEKEMHNSENTIEALSLERARRTQDLEKVQQLETKLNAELKHLREKIQTMKNAMDKIGSIETVKREAEAIKKQSEAERDDLQFKRDTFRTTIQALTAQYEAKKTQLNENETYTQLGALEQRLRYHEGVTFGLKDYIASKIAESDYKSLEADATNRMNEINAQLIKMMALPPAR
ncbi:hypothetical protein BSLG_007117 [Batrachochytrium salamandrivorans]|nr:hypothetical protein BSLG_007117 [Batrachochytrium salamandrivorans]